MKIGLRIDVDTLRGTRDGVPLLCDILADNSIKGSFYFSVGPDNMGRNLWRLFRPTFLKKMIRSKASKLYGWDILKMGVFGEGPIIGVKARDAIKRAADEEHEIGLHAWDHYSWQAGVENYSRHDLHGLFKKGVDMLADITGAPPTCTAAPAWKATNEVLKAKEHFNFRHNSDCRGVSVFRPVVDSVVLTQPQIPVTLPTYDEIIGRDGIDNNNYNEHILSFLKPDQLNVLTIHAEVEGIACSDTFRDFVKSAVNKGFEFVTLGETLKDNSDVPEGLMEQDQLPGRDGWLAVQKQ